MFGKWRKNPTPAQPDPAAGVPGLRHDEIVHAMHLVANADSPDNRAALFRLLLASPLLVITHGDLSRTATADEFNMLTVTSGDETAVPVFTSPDAVQAFRADCRFVAMNGANLFPLIAQSGASRILLNPGSATHGEILRHELDALARGRLPLGKQEVVEAETQVRIGRPAQAPDPELLRALAVTLDSVPETRAAWLFLMQQGDLAPELVLGIEFVPGLSHEAHRHAMRTVVESAGQRSLQARELAFMTAADGLRADLEDGAGVEIFRRR